MTDRQAFVSRLILEAETPLEREAVTELQIAGLELERLRAIAAAAAPFVAMIARVADDGLEDDDTIWDRVHPSASEARAAATLAPMIAKYDTQPMTEDGCRWYCQGHFEGDPYVWHHAPGCPWPGATQEVQP